MREDIGSEMSTSPEEIEPKTFNDLPNAPDGIAIVDDPDNDVNAEEFFGVRALAEGAT